MPILLIVLCAVLLLVAFLLSLRVRLTVRAGESVTLELKILFIRIRLYPKRARIRPRDYSPKRSERTKKKAAKKARKRLKSKHSHTASKEDDKLSLRERITLVRALCAALTRRTHKHLHLHAAQLHVRVATGDPATTALAYGAVTQSVAYLLAGLDRVTHLHATPPDVGVTADFLAEKSQLHAHITFSIRVWGALRTAVPVLFTYMTKKRSLPRARNKKQNKNSPVRKENNHG